MSLLSACLESWTTSKKAKAVRNLPSYMRMSPEYALPASTGVPQLAGPPIGKPLCLLLPSAAFQACLFMGKLLPFGSYWYVPQHASQPLVVVLTRFLMMPYAAFLACPL